MESVCGPLLGLPQSETLLPCLLALPQEVPQEYNGFAYVYEGSGSIGGTNVSIQNAYVLENEGDTVSKGEGWGLGGGEIYQLMLVVEGVQTWQREWQKH